MGSPGAGRSATNRQRHLLPCLKSVTNLLPLPPVCPNPFPHSLKAADGTTQVGAVSGNAPGSATTGAVAAAAGTVTTAVAAVVVATAEGGTVGGEETETGAKQACQDVTLKV